MRGYIPTVFFMIFVIFDGLKTIEASEGENSEVYIKCFRECMKFRCANYKRTPITLTSWTCEEDCNYECMWVTVIAYVKLGWKVPKFHGTWPFRRLLGMQQPASAIFSIFNFLGHFHMFRKFYKTIRYPYPWMTWVYVYLSMVCLVGWACSTVFHIKDTPFTEQIDYSMASAMVLTTCFVIFFRIHYWNRKILAFAMITYILGLAGYTTHLGMGTINYRSNMETLLGIGAITLVYLTIWWWRNRTKERHFGKLVAFTVLTACAASLEIFDFAPIAWQFDSHALWHLLTAPLVSLLYKFIIEDIQYLRQRSQVNRPSNIPVVMAEGPQSVQFRRRSMVHHEGVTDEYLVEHEI